jgi:hypothetical protein
MAKDNELFSGHTTDLDFIRLMKTKPDEGFLADWNAVDVALREIAFVKG